MKTPSQEDLLGYVLGALDAQEQRNVQQSIDDHPEIEEELLRIKNSLIPLDCLEVSGPRPGLARRTCESVASWQNEQAFDSTTDQPEVNRTAPFDSIIRSSIDASTAMTSAPKLRPSVSERILHPKTWSMPDVLVGVALLAVMAGILLPTISYTRDNCRIAACQSNLRQIGGALMKYGSTHEGQIMDFPKDGNLAVIGWIGPMLKDAGFIMDDSIFACPGISASQPPVYIPGQKQIDNASCELEIDSYRRSLCGHFGFAMGYRDNVQYHPPRAGLSHFIVFADQPSGLPGRVSNNHRARGQNVLFGDGSVLFVVGPAHGNDRIYENDIGLVQPGLNEKDNVVAPSHISIVQLAPNFLLNQFSSER